MTVAWFVAYIFITTRLYVCCRLELTVQSRPLNTGSVVVIHGRRHSCVQAWESDHALIAWRHMKGTKQCRLAIGMETFRPDHVCVGITNNSTGETLRGLRESISRNARKRFGECRSFCYQPRVLRRCQSPSNWRHVFSLALNRSNVRAESSSFVSTRTSARVDWCWRGFEGVAGRWDKPRLISHGTKHLGPYNAPANMVKPRRKPCLVAPPSWTKLS